ncbi:class I tRNA ligase family protein [Candidatus Nomurabacteria bacterium]|nr:class I tRNA ligase family protein [Candidatus Nomurabacteria bacterium]
MTDSNSQKKSEVALREEEILKFWQDNQIFEKSLKKPSPNGSYVFYDGPPFATGLPHHGHILASTIKDVVPRYQTMRGKRVERRWGWDTHGLPIENIVEKKLGISGKKEIEKIGIQQFNETARAQVLEYVDAWKRTVERMARWVDFDGAYLTMQNSYIESVWWALKEIHNKGLLYEGEKVLPYCPRCETPIANSEIAMDNSYKDITDISVTVKLELIDPVNDEKSSSTTASNGASELKTYLLAWTTTPWTLPGNVAAAINKDLEYIQVIREDGKYIVAKDLAEKVFKEDVNGEKVNTEDLIGKSYLPVFDYFKDVPLKNKENIWKIWNADYVTTEQGTGIVHLAPVYGEEDMVLAKKVNLPLIYHVAQNGTFIDKVTEFAGIKVKPKSTPEQKDFHQSTDIEIIKNLAHRGKLFSKEKIIHSYPHCFRCETPLFYNALSAWFINIQSVKQRALDLNNKINWVPEHLKEGRFKKSMESAPDWNISRNRYWASPLPFWKSEDGMELKVLGSLDELKEKTKSTNKYFVMRHGEAQSNVDDFVCSTNDVKSDLTEKGKEEVRNSIEFFKNQNIDLIITSPLDRTTQTADIVAKGLGLDKSNVLVDDRIKEIQAGNFNGKLGKEYREQFASLEEKMTKPSKGGESILDLRKRCGDFIYEIDKKYQAKNILIITHEYCVWMLKAMQNGLDITDTVSMRKKIGEVVVPGYYEKYDFATIPHNDNYELDFHRPYIDDITFEENDKKFTRISEVIDCWVESGSMPFAQKHYPFENKENFKRNFPAQFVAEYIAQTRTWFYYTHILSAILFDNVPFENVVTTGNILAEDGSKMSKSKNNFPDPWLIFDKYGVDAERYYLLSSPVVQSEDLNFSEKGVDEIYKKIILRLRNVVSFYKLYADKKVEGSSQSENILDKWILAKLSQTIAEVTENMEAYKLDRAERPILDFIDDLSTWYVRRSRDRFKEDGDKENALKTMKFVLIELSKIMAPFTPYLAEDVYQRIGGRKESVHLEDWPQVQSVSFFAKLFGKKSSFDQSLIQRMYEIRDLISIALEARTKAGIKVRQPLQSMKTNVKISHYEASLIDLIKDEVNVKEVNYDIGLDKKVELDTNITEDLKNEGDSRELIRSIQSLRKNMNLKPSDKITLTISKSAEHLIHMFRKEIESTAGISEFKFIDEDGEVVGLSFGEVKISIVK